MTFYRALALGLAISLASPSFADPLSNPGQEWWTAFFKAVDGAAPDYERIAREDPEYRAADEFSRAEVLARVVERLKAEQAEIDVAGTAVTISIAARLGDYSSETGGFPVDIFAQNMRLQPARKELFFRNWDDFALYAATVEEGKALRQRIGTGKIRAEVTLGDIRMSTTRNQAYDARIVSVAYYADDGLLLAKLDASEVTVIAEADSAAMVETVRQRLSDLAGIPPLGTSWEEAKALLIGQYPIIASDQFFYSDTGKTLAFVHEGGQVITDEAHEAGKPFHIFLQQVDGAWRVRPGFSVDMDNMMYGIDGVDIKATGPGLACYTPDILDRCALLEFSPVDDGHVLSRAYGVVELERNGTPQQVFEGIAGAEAAIFEGFSAPVGYDSETLRLGTVSQFPGRASVQAYAAGAGATRDGKPIYDPLKNTTGITAINREIAIFAVDGAEARVPLIFVLQ